MSRFKIPLKFHNRSKHQTCFRGIGRYTDTRNAPSTYSDIHTSVWGKIKWIKIHTVHVYSEPTHLPVEIYIHGCTRKSTSNSYFLLSTPCKASNNLQVAWRSDVTLWGSWIIPDTGRAAAIFSPEIQLWPWLVAKHASLEAWRQIFSTTYPMKPLEWYAKCALSLSLIG